MTTVTAHWDEAPGRRVDIGPLGADWTFLGRAAGSDRIGVRRIRIWPGRQSTPVHAHFGEEEIFYVLDGSGWSWQEGAVHPVAAGDVMFHPAGGPAHTVVAGEAGIDVLAFGDNLRHEAVRFPRIDATWVGGMILEHVPRHQFELEAERAGPVEIPEQPDPRPDTTLAVADVEPRAIARGAVETSVRFLSRALGARHTALNQTTVAPGAESAPPHCHSAIEELFVVLEGDGVLLLGDAEEEHPVRAGSLVARPAGTGVAHALRAGPHGLTMLAYSDLDPRDMCLYPRTGKVLVRGLGIVIRPEQVPYWDDEA
jgi:uncharacterized cupin superfamily protein